MRRGGAAPRPPPRGGPAATFPSSSEAGRNIQHPCTSPERHTRMLRIPFSAPMEIFQGVNTNGP